MLFVSKSHQHVRIEVGYGLEGDLPDARAKQIIDETIVPQLKADNPGCSSRFRYFSDPDDDQPSVRALRTGERGIGLAKFERHRLRQL